MKYVVVHAGKMCIPSDFHYNNNDDEDENVFQHLIVLFGRLFVYFTVSSHSVTVMINGNVVIGLSSVPPFGERIGLIYKQQAGHCYEINVFIFQHEPLLSN